MSRPWWSLAAFALSSCASVGAVQTADTLGAGRLEYGLEPGAQLASTAQGTPGSQGYGHADAVVRYGLTETIDVGARLGMSMLELQGKFALLPRRRSLPALALAPALGGIVVPGGRSMAGVLSFALPVLVGFRTLGANELTIGVRVQGIVAGTSVTDGGSGSVFALGAGASVGYAMRFGAVSLIPELAFVHPLVVSGTSGAAAGLGSTVVQFKVGVLFGGPWPVLLP